MLLGNDIWSLTEKGLNTHLTLEEARTLFRKMVKIFAEERKKKKETVAVEEEAPPEKEIAAPINFGERLSQVLLSIPPTGFERLCQRLLRESGFVQVVVTGRSGDGGIDGHGTIQVNPLVSFKVLFQCKRFSNAVTPAIVRDFRGAMQSRADKGIIMTTGGVHKRGAKGSDQGRSPSYRTCWSEQDDRHVHRIGTRRQTRQIVRR